MENEQDNLTQTVTSQLSEEEYQILVEQGKKIGLSVSDLTRSVLIDYIEEIKYWKRQNDK